MVQLATSSLEDAGVYFTQKQKIFQQIEIFGKILPETSLQRKKKTSKIKTIFETDDTLKAA